jgi:hypothetical protein
MAKKFDFLSPGIEIREIDQSFLPQEAEAAGPIIIGRTRKGPANKPVRIRNLDDYVSVFGLPIPGGAGPQGDVWRDGNTSGPTYASYAAQAWLASENSPVTVVRIAGDQHPQATDAGKAGWSLDGDISTNRASNSTAYGLFLIASGATAAMETGSLAAVLYANEGYLALSGANAAGTDVEQAGTFVRSVDANSTFKLVVGDASTGKKTYDINFSRNSSKYIRTVLNTNPQLTNTAIIPSAQQETYWLGESFAREVEDLNLHNSAAGATYGILLPLQSGSASTYNWGAHREAAAEAGTGWVISQKEKNQVDLFRLKSLHVGEDIQKDYMIAIENISAPANPVVNPFGSFTVAVKTISGQTVERYVNVNFNPSSPDYIAKRIGDQYMEWSETDRRYRTYGDFQNQSNIVYVELKQFIKDGGGQGFLPAGFKGPVRPKGFTLLHNSQNAHALGVTVDSLTAAFVTLRFGDGTQDSAVPTASDVLSLNLLGTTHEITFTSGGGTDTTFTLNTGTGVQEANIDLAASTTAEAIRDAVSTLIASRGLDITLSEPADGTGNRQLKILSDEAGPTYVITSDLSNITANVVEEEAVVGSDDVEFAGVFAKGNASMPSAGGDANNFVSGPTNFTASFLFPSLALRGDGTEGGAPDPYRAYYGIRPKISTTSNTNDPDYCDYLRRLPAGIDNYVASGDFEQSFTFTLDDLVILTGSNSVTYSEGSYDLGSGSTGSSFTVSSGSYAELLNLGVRQFLMPLHGGFDGFDVTEKEPLRDDLISTTRNDKADYIHYTINKALDSVADPEVVPANMLMVPGIRKPVITDRVIDLAERRKDVLAIVDLEGDYKPLAERRTADTDASSLGSVSTAVSSIKQRNLNSSYACAFYPWVQAADNLNGGNLVWLPPSVAALGAFGRSQSQSELWFAPAGFNRGGLGALGGARGPKVLQARQRLDSKERDLLYEVNINPIATFPAEGVVIFGQKTLQADASALDRINVRRLLLYLKAEVAGISRNLLFDQNVESTWNRFKSQVEPLLSGVSSRFGLSDYKLVLDDTTTTADLIDRNIMYAKIYIKPARAIEYIVVDFVITNTGADFV